ncbi:MAG TPA: ATP-binding protein [Blastocatellia bacterium]|nr:ATP-binding protein [Blastocatellia bacterium]
MSKTFAARNSLHPAAPVHMLILESWRRCRAAQLDPDHDLASSHGVSSEDLQRRLQDNQELLAVAIPHLELLNRALARLPNAVYLVDREGIILYLACADDEIGRAFGLFPGYESAERQIGTNGAGTALVTKQPVAVVGTEHFSSRFHNYTTIGVPIHNAEGDVIGAIGISADIAESSQQLLDLARRVARFIEKEIGYTEEIRRAESFKLIARVQSVTDAALAHLSLDSLLEELLSRIRKSMGVPIAGFLLKDPDGDMLVMRTPGGLKKERGRGIRVPGDMGFGRHIVSNWQPTIVDDIESAEEFSPLLRGIGIRSLMGAPLLVEGWMIGVVFIGTVYRSQFNASDSHLLSLIADRVALALNRVCLYESERDARLEAEAASYAKDDLLVTASEKLRSSFRSLLDWTRTLQSGSLDRAEAARAIQSIERSAASQAQTIENALDVIRIINGSLSLDVRPIDLASIIWAAVDAVRPSAHAKSIQLQMSLDSDVGTVSGDRNRLQQVFWNLLSNAVKFTPEGGQVHIRLERVNSFAQIKVIDTGRGIARRFLPHVFDLFGPADSSFNRKPEGSGFGLGIVRHLVELHQGTVSAESAGEGRGATFTVKLPIAPAHAAEHYTAERAASGYDEPARLEGLGILLIEDDPELRDSLILLVAQHGADVRASAAASLEAMEEWRPDLLVSDVDIPGGYSYKLISRVSALEAERGERIPVAALPAYAMVKYWMKSLPAGSQMRLAKPVEPARLLKSIVKFSGSPEGTGAGGV